jgi:hypothetical protein
MIAQAVKVLVTGAVRGQRGRFRLDDVPHFEQLFPDAIVPRLPEAVIPEEKIRAEGPDKGAASVPNLDYSERSQFPHRLTHRRAAHAEFGSKLGLTRQPMAYAVGTAAQHSRHRVDHLMRRLLFCDHCHAP